MADFSSNKKYNYNWQNSKFKDIAISGSNISQFINDAGYVTSTSGIDTGSFVTTSSFNHYTGSNLSTFAGTASFALTASYFSGSISNAVSASYAQTASYVLNAVSSSYTATASYVNPLYQDVIITGSLLVTQSHISTVDYIDFTLLPSDPIHQEGRIHWVDDTKTINVDTDVNNFYIEVGHQNVVRVRNVTGGVLAKGKIVYIDGESGNRPTVVTASWGGDPSSATTLGWIVQNINDSQTGYALTNGILRDINTSAYPPGTMLYLSSSGDYTSTIPVSPKHEVRLGQVITQGVAGTIYVNIMNGYELGELHDVLITGSSNGDLVVKSGSIWINSKQLTGSYTVTGSLTATSLTGSLLGTASWATNAITASYALESLSSSFASTASYVQNAQTSSYVLNAVSSSFATTASFITASGVFGPYGSNSVISSSYALTASYALNGGGGTTDTGSLLVTASIADSTITFTKGDGSTFPIVVPTGSGSGTVSGGVLSGSFGITIDGAGSVLIIGNKGYATIPYSGTITGWTMIANQTGDCVIDVWKAAGTIPTVADTITGIEKPTLSSQQIASDLSLSTWATSVTAGDVFAFYVDSTSTITRVNLSIYITKQ